MLFCRHHLLNTTFKKNKKGYAISPKQPLYKIYKRASFSLLSKYYKGSMAVEASLVMPLFIFAMLNLNAFMDMYELQLNKSIKVYEEVRIACTGETLLNQVGINPEKDVTLFELYEGKPAIGILGFNEIPLISIFTAKPWTGYETSAEQSLNEEETVFITPSGEAYHKTDNCPYLKLSLQAVDRAKVSDKRNLDGEKYRACKECGSGMGDSLFITDYGNQYHTSLECSSLKRTILEVSKESIESRHECPKCYGY